MKSASVCSSVTVPMTSQAYIRGRSSPHGPISRSCQSQRVGTFGSGSAPINLRSSSQNAALELQLRHHCPARWQVQHQSPSIRPHPGSTLSSLPPWAVTKQNPPVQEKVCVVKDASSSGGVLTFLSLAAGLMYYSHSPSCLNLCLAGSFL